MAAERHDGLILLADVSGYTGFVGGTELEHGRIWMSRLLDLIAQCLTARLSLSAVEGDALLLYRCFNEPEAGLPGLLDSTYQEFRALAATIDPCMGCACAACDSGKDLQLKYIAHAGEFVEQHVAGRVQLFGHDVNVAHRLLKNRIPAKQYVFVTDAGARYLDLGPAAVRHVEQFDVGEIRGSYRLLS